MTGEVGGGHTPVNVNLAPKHRSAGAPTHQKRKKGPSWSLQKEYPAGLVIYIKYTMSQAGITMYTTQSLHLYRLNANTL